jgi:hypothetical protein
MPVSAPSLSIANPSSLITALTVSVGKTALQEASATAFTATSLIVTGQTYINSLGVTSGAGGAYTTSLVGSSSASQSYSYTLPASDGSYGQVLTTNANGVLSWTTPGGGAGATPTYTKTYTIPGMVPILTGTNRWYPDASVTLIQFYATVSSPPVGAAASFAVKKNGISIGTITIATNQYKSSVTSITTALLATDYITVDVTATNSIADASVIMIYQR